jgi:hypothetical protein
LFSLFLSLPFLSHSSLLWIIGLNPINFPVLAYAMPKQNQNSVCLSVTVLNKNRFYINKFSIPAELWKCNTTLIVWEIERLECITCDWTLQSLWIPVEFSTSTEILLHLFQSHFCLQ